MELDALKAVSLTHKETLAPLELQWEFANEKIEFFSWNPLKVVDDGIIKSMCQIWLVGLESVSVP